MLQNIGYKVEYTLRTYLALVYRSPGSNLQTERNSFHVCALYYSIEHESLVEWILRVTSAVHHH